MEGLGLAARAPLLRRIPRDRRPAGWACAGCCDAGPGRWPCQRGGDRGRARAGGATTLTLTRAATLPCTVTGSWPRPRWFDVSLWGRPLDTGMMDVHFREELVDAPATLVSDEERAGLDTLTHGDLHGGDDVAGRSWHHYPLQRWAGFAGDELQSEGTRSPWLRYPPGTRLSSSARSRAGGRSATADRHRAEDRPALRPGPRCRRPGRGPPRVGRLLRRGHLRTLSPRREDPRWRCRDVAALPTAPALRRSVCARS